MSPDNHQEVSYVLELPVLTEVLLNKEDPQAYLESIFKDLTKSYSIPFSIDYDGVIFETHVNKNNVINLPPINYSNLVITEFLATLKELKKEKAVVFEITVKPMVGFQVFYVKLRLSR